MPSFKSHLCHLVRVLDYYAEYIDRGPAQFCDLSSMVTTCVLPILLNGAANHCDYCE